MQLGTNNSFDREQLVRINSGEVFILAGNESTAAIVQHTAHAEFVTPGAAVGGSFDREVTAFYSIGNITLTVPLNAQARQQAIKHRQADIDRMLEFWKEKDALDRTISVFKLLCQKLGIDRVKNIPPDVLERLTGASADLIDRAWHRLSSIDITPDVVAAPPSVPSLPLLPPQTETYPEVRTIEIANIFTSSTLSGYPAPVLQNVSEIRIAKPHKFLNGKIIMALGTMALAGIGLSFYMLSNFIFPRPDPQISAAPNVEPKKPKSVSALGYIEPKGRVILLSAPAFMEGSRVEKLLVRQGDSIKQGTTVAILDNRDRLQSILEQAQQNVKIAQAKLQQVKAGSKTGDIKAQTAKSRRSKAELVGQVSAQQAAIANIQAQLEGERSTQEALILQIKAELTNAEKECSRYQMLEEEGVVSKSQRDNNCLTQSTTKERLAQANSSLTRIINTRRKQLSEANANLQRTIETSKNEIAAADASIDAVSEVRPVDVQLAQQEIISAQAAVKKAQADLAQAYVRSPLNGQVLKINTFPGELVNQQKGIAELGRTEQMYVNADIYETDIGRIRVGQKVTIRADRVIGALSGYVDRVGIRIGTPSTLGTDPVKEADVRVVEVKIRLIPKDSKKLEI